MDQALFTKIKDFLTPANSVIILLPAQPDADSLTAAIALHLSLKQVGKTSTIASSDLGSAPQIEGISEVKKQIGNQKLVVSFDYKEDSVENVSYDIDEGNKRFNLIIQPRTGQPPLDKGSVQFSYSGASADLVITFGINSLEELGKIYSDEKAFLDQAKLVNIVNSPRPSTFAEVNILTSGKSYAETIGLLLKFAQFALPESGATLLYHQLSDSTDNFQSNDTNADTFELAAYLLRHNAKRPATPAPMVLSPDGHPRPAPQIFRPQGGSFPPSQKSPFNGGTPTFVPTDWQKPKIFKSAFPSPVAPPQTTLSTPSGQLK